MIPEKQAIQQIIFDAIDDLNRTLEEDKRLTRSLGTILFGPGGGKLDSLGMINFMLIIQNKINQTFQLKLTMFNERLLSQQEGNLRTVARLIDYVLNIVTQQISTNQVVK